MPRAAAAALVVALAIGAPLCGGAPSAAAAAGTVKVASYNVDSAWREVSQPEIPFWDARVVGIRNIVTAARPDVIGVQEAHNIWVGTRYYTQASDVQRLTGYAMYQPADAASSRIPILWRGGLLEATAAGYKIFEFKPYPDYGRAMTWVKLRFRTAGSEFFVFNTHFESGAAGRAARKAEAAMLAAEIVRVNSGGLPAFVTGDFNDSATGSAPQTRRLNAIGYVDSFGQTAARMHPEFETFNRYTLGIVGDSRIDQVFVAARNVTVHYWENWRPHGDQVVGGRPPSDHDLIYAVATIG